MRSATGDTMMKNSVNNNLISSQPEQPVLNIRVSVTDPKTYSVDRAEPPKLLMFVAAFLQKADSQDSHLKLLRKRFRLDRKEFGRFGSSLLLIKNIVTENPVPFIAVKDRLCWWAKWIVGLTFVKQLGAFIYHYLTGSL